MSNVSKVYKPHAITLREVGLRDGLQLVKTFPSSAEKCEWIRREYDAGVRHFEIGSFLPASRFPQFADIRELIDAVGARENAFAAALALNERGAEDAFSTGLDEVMCVLSATEEHSLANARRSRASAVELVAKIRAMRDQAGHKAIVTAAISMSFGCTLAGTVEPDEVLRLVDALMDAGAEVIGLADTVGYAGPRQVGELTEQTRKLIGDVPLCIHLHDTRGMGLANASAALDGGADILDASLGGLGGCPFAPGATGNIVFEDVVYLCETKGFATGIDPDALKGPREVAERSMPGETFYGAIARAGTPANVPWRLSA
ncbi:MAG: hydroxymethylglutaryl-CoA lyase [Pseudomonadota bacterium]